MSEVKRSLNAPMWREIDGLRQQTVGQLRVKYLEVFRQESRSNNQKFLVRRLAWRLQANAEGGLSERARQREVEVADQADLRIRAPQSFLKELEQGNRDPRLPAVGMCLMRQFQGRTVSVEALEKGFRAPALYLAARMKPRRRRHPMGTYPRMIGPLPSPA